MIGEFMRVLGVNKKQIINRLIIRSLVFFGCFAFIGMANAQTIEDYEMIPPLSEFQRVNPKVMLAISGDHQMFMKAYNDWDDLDGDNIPDVTYNTNIQYSGYFDSARCYKYSGNATAYTNRADQINLFEPVDGLADYISSAATGSIEHDVRQFCEAAEWSGNFLNWATMTRMDIVRYVLYGGKRSTDTATETVLERAYLPNDAHSFAKYYDGPYISELTSFGGAESGYVSRQSASCASGEAGEDCRKRIGITFCNTTTGQTEINYTANDSQIQSLKPKMRVAMGNYSLWASSERFQCLLGVENVSGSDSFREFTGYNGNDYTNNSNVPAETGIDAYDGPPLLATSSSSSTWVGDFNVAVKVCDSTSSGDDPDGADHICRKYPDGTIKPIGILQVNGEKESNPTEFGLVTRSFKSNKTGGLLRSNVLQVSEEIDPDTGVFKVNADNNSLIGFLNELTIVDYQAYSLGGDDENMGYYFRNGANSCPPQAAEFSEGQCKNWGNPFSEVMAEAYKYLANSNQLMTGVTVDSDYFGALPSPVDPLYFPQFGESPDFSCVNFNVVGFNASAVSYDEDINSSTFTSLGITNSTDTVGDWTNRVAELDDFINGTKQFFIGDTANENDPATQCSPKTLGFDGAFPNLAGASGTCPDAPGLDGGFGIAGLAYHARTNDLRPDRPEKEFTVETFGITLAGNVPSINVPVGGQTVRIVPACRVLGEKNDNNDWGDLGNCALVDFKPIIENPNEIPKRYLIVWEDSEQGSDYDQDMMGIIEYEIESSELKVRTKVFSESTQALMLFGYVISGVGEADESEETNEDGVYYDSWIQTDGIAGIEDANRTDENNDGVINDQDPIDFEAAWKDINSKNSRGDYDPLGEGTNVNRAGRDTDLVFNRYINNSWREFPLPNESTVAAEFLDAPLYYAAKYGSFEDENDNGVYDPGIDTIPVDEKGDLANYALVREPSKLRAAVAKILNNVTDGAKTRTAAAVAAGSVTGQGLALQSLYAPEFKSDGGDTVSWVGFLNGLFVDDKGNYREDYDGDGVLDGDGTDYVVEFTQEEDSQTVVFNRYTYGLDGKINRDSPIGGTDLPLTELRPTWSAHQRLAQLSEADLETNRTSSGYLLSDSKRYIFTGVDTSGAAADGQIDEDEVVPFTEAQLAVTPDLAAMLDAEDAAEAANIVKYIRGIEVDGFRSRTYKPSAAATNEEVWRLGDIVHSTPVIVGRPDAGFDRDYGDETYAAYVKAKKNRRHMVYVGANDGMLHGFNAGFFDAVNNQYVRTEPGTNATQGPPLGTEMWAYVPHNALPHLKWLTDPQYSHVFYVDTEIKTFDTNIFAGSEPGCEDDLTDTYTCGWGTILVAGMRFGGKDYSVDLDGDGVTDTTARSSYVIMDITDPEKPPKLIAEISHPELGFAMGAVDMVKKREQGADTGTYFSVQNGVRADDWYLVFGSGPNGTDAYDVAYSEQAPALFSLNLRSAWNGNAELQKVPIAVDGTAHNAYVGGITAVDWDKDFSDDMLYFGLVGDVHSTPEPLDPELPFRGALMQAELWTGNGSNNTLFSTANPGNSVDLLLDHSLLAADSDSDGNIPFSTKPLAIKDRSNTYWVYAGTGKFLVKSDLEAELPNAFFGLRVNNLEWPDQAGSMPWLQDGNISPSNLFDSGSAAMKVDAQYTPYVTQSGNTQFLYDFVNNLYTSTDDGGQGKKGWQITFNESKGETTFNNPVFTYNTVVFNTYLPEVENCAQAGDSLLYLRDMFTGLPSPHIQGSLNNLNFQTDTDLNIDLAEVNEFPVDEDGNPPQTPPGPPVPPSVDNLGRLFAPGCQENCGKPVGTRAGTVSWREISLDELE